MAFENQNTLQEQQFRCFHSKPLTRKHIFDLVLEGKRKFSLAERSHPKNYN